PAGIADALKKIGGYHAGSQVQAANASEYSHMFFSRATGRAFSSFMATHPPLEERIRRVQPDWDGSFTTPQPEAAIEPRPEIDRSRATLGVLHAAAAGTLAGGQSSAQATPLPADASREAIEAIGWPSAKHVAYARQTIAALDPELREAAHDPYATRALIYGLLLDTSDPVRSRQLASLEQNADP